MQSPSGQPSLNIPECHLEGRGIILHLLRNLPPSSGDISSIEMKVGVHGAEVRRSNDELRSGRMEVPGAADAEAFFANLHAWVSASL